MLQIANVPLVRSQLRCGTIAFIVFSYEDNEFRLKMNVVAVIVGVVEGTCPPKSQIGKIGK